MPTVRTYVRALPDAEVALLRDTFDPAAHDRLLADAAAIGARAVSAHQDVVTPAFIAAAAERGLAVYCWYQRLERAAGPARGRRRRGLAGVVTDWPADARRVPGCDADACSHRGRMCAQCVSKADVVVGSIGFAAFLFKGPGEDALVAMGLLPEPHPLAVGMRTVNFLRDLDLDPRRGPR